MTIAIAIVSERKYLEHEENRWLHAALQQQDPSATVDVLAWEDESVMWTRYDAIFAATTWNIPAMPDAFLAWVARCEADGRQRLINSATVLRKGVRKYDHMALLLQAFGETPSARGWVIPSRYYTRTAPPTPLPLLTQVSDASFEAIIARLDEDSHWRGRDLVIKPVISADSIDTFVYQRSGTSIPTQHSERLLTTASAAEAVFMRLLDTARLQGVIVQVYDAAVTQGEYSLTFFNNTLSHAVQKEKAFIATNSANRRYVAAEALPEGMLEFAQRVLAFAEGNFGKLTRCRVDLFADASGPRLSEMEMIDPNTNMKILEAHDPALRQHVAANYAQALLERAKELASQTA